MLQAVQMAFVLTPAQAISKKAQTLVEASKCQSVHMIPHPRSTLYVPSLYPRRHVDVGLIFGTV